MAETAGLVFAVLSAADLCIKYGKELLAKYRAYVIAELMLEESLIRIQHFVLMTESELGVLKDEKTVAVLEERVQDHLRQVLEVLQLKLQAALHSVDRVVDKKGIVKKVKYALFMKERLDGTILELERWNAIFQPSWFLLVRSSNPNFDRLLSRQRHPNSGLHKMRSLRDAVNSDRSGIKLRSNPSLVRRSTIKSSPAIIAFDQDCGKSVVVDILPMDSGPGENNSTLRKDIEKLARVLSQVEPMLFGMLACSGAVESTNSIELVFDIPDGLSNPRSLRSLLEIRDRDQKLISLTEKTQLAKLMAKSVLFLHTAKFVHKNIRPETILLLQSDDAEAMLGTPFLVGFDKFRTADGFTRMHGDANWSKNLYRHPSRQGFYPEDMYRMQHDIYSLGVCLLEIGLWTSFVEVNQTGDASPSPLLEINDFLPIKDTRRKANLIKKRLVSLANERLPERMGAIYTDIVVTCLLCLDRDNMRFGDEDEFSDEDDIVVGIRYIEKILGRLEEINV